MNHDTQKNPYEQEVKIERKEHGASQRRADYAFYITPNFRDVKFYIEAKKPFGDIATPDNYFQTIRYGWGSKTPIAVLFDFEQFEIVDRRFKPDLESALQRNLKKFHFSQYADTEKFAEIYWLFSREAVAGDALEKYAETLPKRRGTAKRGLFKGGDQDIDEAFLEELDAHRDTLAHIFNNSNPKLDGESLTEATQRTLAGTMQLTGERRPLACCVGRLAQHFVTPCFPTLYCESELGGARFSTSRRNQHAGRGRSPGNCIVPVKTGSFSSFFWKTS